MDDPRQQHLSPALFARSEAYDPEEAEADDPDIEQRDTYPCASPQDWTDETSPESDGKPIEHLHLQLAFRSFE